MQIRAGGDEAIALVHLFLSYYHIKCISCENNNLLCFANNILVLTATYIVDITKI